MFLTGGELEIDAEMLEGTLSVQDGVMSAEVPPWPHTQGTPSGPRAGFRAGREAGGRRVSRSEWCHPWSGGDHADTPGTLQGRGPQETSQAAPCTSGPQGCGCNPN